MIQKGGLITNTIKEVRETEIIFDCDVLIAGGGVAGIAAALAAARNGSKVMLCEKEFALGGLATLGLVTIYLPLCDGCGHQMSFGIAEELLRLSIKYGAQDRYPKAWLENGNVKEKAKKRFEVQYNPHVFAVLAEQQLISEGVKIMYGTVICGVDMKNGKINAVITENKSGRQAIKVKSVVDATGDADICYLSGEKTAMNKNGNPLAAWYYSSGEDGFKLHMMGYADIPDNEKRNEELTPLEKSKISGVDAEEISNFIVLGHRHIIKDFASKHEQDDTYEPAIIPSIPQMRMTRRLKGVFELEIEHCNTHFADSIGVIGSWRKRGPICEIPFSALYGEKVKNLITAGRCISSVGDMWDLTRVIPACAVTGEAAGTAAAMSDDFEKLSVSDLQQNLCRHGVKISADGKLYIKDDYTISDDFCGGNITVLEKTENRASLAINFRDSEPWCYWAFRVVGAAGKTICFDFGTDAVGYFGAAVSHDLVSWHWSDYEHVRRDSKERFGFTYTFAQGENDVYFAHNMQYLPQNFEKLDFLQHEILCHEENGLEIPIGTMGNGEKIILLTARHHACEAPASYILEGVLRTMNTLLPENYKIVCVPFVDYAGVVAGDQGKGRAPHDHNRDYNETIGSLYPSVNAIRKLLDAGNVRYAFDFHSPCHLGGGNDIMSFACGFSKHREKTCRLSKLFYEEITDDCFFFPDGNISFREKPGRGMFQTYVGTRSSIRFVTTLESPYFGTAENRMSSEKYIETGKALGRAVIQFINEID